MDVTIENLMSELYEYIRRNDAEYDRKVFEINSNYELTPEERKTRIKAAEDRKSDVHKRANIILSAYKNVESYQRSLDTVNEQFSRIKEAIDIVAKIYPPDSKEIVDGLYKNYRQSKSIATSELSSKLEKAKLSAKEASEKYGKYISVDSRFSVSSFYELSRKVRYLHTPIYVNDDFTPHASMNIEEKMGQINKIQEDIKAGNISGNLEVDTKKFVFHTKKSYSPYTVIVNAKSILEQIASKEKIESAIKHAIMVISASKQNKNCEKLLDFLNKLSKSINSQKEKLNDELDSLPFEELQKQEAKLEVERRKQSAIENYSYLYYRLLKETDPIEKAKIESSLNEIITQFNLDENDVWKAQNQAKEKLHNEEINKMWDESRKISEQMEHENMDIAQKAEYDRLYEEIARKLAMSGWTPAGGTPMKNGNTDVDFVEDSRLFHEEVDRRVKEKMGLLRSETGDKSIPVSQDYNEFGSSEDVSIARESISDAISNDIFFGMKPSENVSSKVDFYMQTIGMSAEERALKSLIADGIVSPDETLESISSIPYKKDALRVQIQHESAITDALAKLAFNSAKSELRSVESNERNKANVNSNLGRHL